MVETKFTKGPWKAVPDTMTRIPDKIYRVIGPSDVYVHDDGICRFDHYNGRSFEEDKANMQLISAAPELYEALEGMLKYIPDGIVECRGDKCREPWCASCCGFEEAESALDQIRFDYQRSKIALAKARGE